MGFMDDLKTDQRTQMLVTGIVFFSLAFPLYFNYAASDVDEFQASGPIGNYSVEGTYSYHLLGSGDETINDGESADLSINSDSISSEIDGKNIVGVRATLTYTDNEQSPPLCGSEEDDVTGHLMHSDLHSTEEVNSGDVVEILWHDSTIIDTTVSNMSESEIIALLENSEERGMGEHFLQISVDVNKGNCADQIRETNDNDETVSYTWELISLEYTITAVE